MHQQSDGVTMKSPLMSLVELETLIIGTMGYMKLNLQKDKTRLVMFRMITLLGLLQNKLTFWMEINHSVFFFKIIFLKNERHSFTILIRRVSNSK